MHNGWGSQKSKGRPGMDEWMAGWTDGWMDGLAKCG